jgi:hypothetical protein
MTHRIRAHLTPADVGKSITRNFQLKGDELLLAFAARRGEVAVSRTLRWRRMD